MPEFVNMQQEQVNRWQRAGHEPVWERGTVRLREFKKSFPRDLEVTVRVPNSDQYAPLILSCGRALKCSEVLPERADLALDAEGRLLSQAEFEQRYEQYLASFVYPAGSDLAFEPVPNVVEYVRMTPDPYSESKGLIEIGFDPKLGEEFKPKARYGPNGESEEEWLKESQKNMGDVSAALKTLADNQSLLTQLLMQRGIDLPGITQAAQGVSVDVAVEAAGESDTEVAPCGAKIAKNYLKQHQRHCNSEDCGGVGVNSKKGA